MPKRTITFRKEELEISIGYYRFNNRKSIQLITPKRELFLTATVNIDEIELLKNEVMIKNYGENEGIYEALLKAEIISPAKRIVKSTFAQFEICDLKI